MEGPGVHQWGMLLHLIINYVLKTYGPNGSFGWTRHSLDTGGEGGEGVCAEKTATGMTQHLFLSTIGAQPCLLAFFLTTKTVVRNDCNTGSPSADQAGLAEESASPPPPEPPSSTPCFFLKLPLIAHLPHHPPFRRPKAPEHRERHVSLRHTTF